MDSISMWSQWDLFLNVLIRPRCDIIQKRGKAQENVYFLKIVCIISLIRLSLYILLLISLLLISLKQHNQLTTLLAKKKREHEALSRQILELDKEMNEIERVLKRHDY